MTVILYRSTDTSAPTLSGTAGDLITVLDAVLVNGYGSKAAAGWTKPYAGTATATYRQGTGSNQYYLNINDNGPGAGTGKEARFFGSETASAVLTGTNLFPTAAQKTNGLFIRKSSTADATQRVWVILADARTVYMWTLTADTANVYVMWMFGEYYSYKSTDLGRTMIIGRITENDATTGGATNDYGDCALTTAYSSTVIGHYVARDNQGTVGSTPSAKSGDYFYSQVSVNSSYVSLCLGTLAYPNSSDSRLYLAPIRVLNSTPGNVIRGRLRGLWHFIHPATSAADGDTVSGTQDLAGKSYLFLKLAPNGGSWCLETSNTWDTN